MTEVREGGLDHPATTALLLQHFDRMLQHSPCGSCHFLDLTALAAPGVTFWTAWDGDALLGCGAMKLIAPGHGEIKSMRTADTALRRGVASALLEAIVARAKALGLERLSLETGSGEPFAAAQALYARHGFEACGPFGTYEVTEFNRYMTRAV
ncbi:GNAT family N-acetyltransferase [Sphingomonas japonica]|uniref:Acetyltransferase n=1 Tax=Sphingomonas japonica TaxID=511662 RepID=A0ABX0U3H8_9SPHN|nr:GNAT family N-acetyltransferase [Sphingomonas japonica]NIJ23902.1 putative acetyltransferase [Sphingomonas japonica]